MKKSLIAMAVLAASGASFAQSSVTLSGALALGVGTTKFGDNSSGLQIARQTGNLNFAGTEDLGGGLKAGFQLQTSIGAIAATNFTPGADGATRTILGDRGANLTLNGGFGTVLVGRSATAVRSLFGSIGDVSQLGVMTGLSAASSADGTLAAGGLVNLGGNDANARVIYGDTFSNQVTYTSPNFSGFAVAVAVGPRQDVATGIGNSDTQKDNASYSLVYRQGKIAAAINLTDSATSTTASGAKTTTVLGSYDFGVARVGLTYQTISMKTGVNPGSGLSLTASAPIGAGVIGLGYGRRSASASTVFGDDVKQTFVGYRHNLSKRTNVQAVYNRIDRTGTATDLRETHLIVAHSF